MTHGEGGRNQSAGPAKPRLESRRREPAPTHLRKAPASDDGKFEHIRDGARFQIASTSHFQATLAAKDVTDVYVSVVLYNAPMKRLQIYIEEAVDEELARRAVREGTSKAALIREYVAERLGAERTGRDPLDALVGRYDAEPGSIDELVYGS